MRRWTRRRHGFSLVEMVAALLIFSVGVVGVLEVFSVCLRAGVTTQNYTRAGLMAQGVMEETLATGELVPGQESGDFGELFPDATYQLEVLETDLMDLYEVVVYVYWTERETEKSVELRTLAAVR